MIIPSSEAESLRSFVDNSGGEVVKETKTRKSKQKGRDDECHSTNTVENAGNEDLNL